MRGSIAAVAGSPLEFQALRRLGFLPSPSLGSVGLLGLGRLARDVRLDCAVRRPDMEDLRRERKYAQMLALRRAASVRGLVGRWRLVRTCPNGPGKGDSGRGTATAPRVCDGQDGGSCGVQGEPDGDEDGACLGVHVDLVGDVGGCRGPFIGFLADLRSEFFALGVVAAVGEVEAVAGSATGDVGSDTYGDLNGLSDSEQGDLVRRRSELLDVELCVAGLDAVGDEFPLEGLAVSALSSGLEHPLSAAADDSSDEQALTLIRLLFSRTHRLISCRHPSPTPLVLPRPS